MERVGLTGVDVSCLHVYIQMEEVKKSMKREFDECLSTMLEKHTQAVHTLQESLEG